MQTDLNNLAQQGSRIVSTNNNVQWVLDTPTEQQIIVFDIKEHKATHYARMRPHKDSQWYDWKIIEKVDLQ